MPRAEPGGVKPTRPAYLDDYEPDPKPCQLIPFPIRMEAWQTAGPARAGGVPVRGRFAAPGGAGRVAAML
jgi:hypothetical protein